MSLTCSNCHQSSCADSGSCDNSDDQGFESVHRHVRQGSCGSAKFRRHKSASPSRRSGSRPKAAGGGGRAYEARGHSRGGGEARSKSAGHLTNQCHHHCHCNCEPERRQALIMLSLVYKDIELDTRVLVNTAGF